MMSFFRVHTVKRSWALWLRFRVGVSGFRPAGFRVAEEAAGFRVEEEAAGFRVEEDLCRAVALRVDGYEDGLYFLPFVLLLGVHTHTCILLLCFSLLTALLLLLAVHTHTYMRTNRLSLIGAHQG